MNTFAVSLNTDFFIARFSCHFPFSVTAVVCHILFLLLTISFFLLHYSFILPFLSINPPLCIHSGFFFYQTKRIFAIRFCRLQPYYNSPPDDSHHQILPFLFKKKLTPQKRIPLPEYPFTFCRFAFSCRFTFSCGFAFFSAHLCCSCWIM